MSTNLVDMLGEGDLRSIGRANEVAKRVLREPRQFGQLIKAMENDDPVVRAHAADAAEKVTAERPELLKPHKSKLLGDLAKCEQQEVRWHVAVMLPRLELSKRDTKRAAKVLRGFLDDDSRIVRVMAMQGLADLALQNEDLLPEVRELLERLTQDGTAAMKARGRKLLKQLDRAKDAG